MMARKLFDSVWIAEILSLLTAGIHYGSIKVLVNRY